MGRIDGRVALVTGASRGIGARVAKRLAEEGASVLLTDILEDTSDVTGEIRKDGGNAHFVHHDVTSEKDWDAAVKAAQDELGGLDILVNNAGIFLSKPITETTLEDFRRVMAINVDGVFLGTKHCLPAIAERGTKWAGGGSIINLSSVAGLTGAPYMSAYNASKGAVRLLTKSTALECAATGMPVRINSIHPGVIDTPMGTQLVNEFADRADTGANEARAAVSVAHPVGHFGEPLDIANAALFLASSESKFMTGSEVVVDGGMTAQ